MVGIRLRGFIPRFEDFRFREPIDWQIHPGESWAVVGPNGAGKSLLSGILQGRIAGGGGAIDLGGAESLYGAVRAMEFRDLYSLVDERGVYYQQRWNASDREQVPLAGAFFENLPEESYMPYLRRFGLEDLPGKRVISLSSGELRKLLIVRALASNPGLLILDNPFIGLDAASREQFFEMLEQIKPEGGTQLVLLLSDPAELPGWIDRVLPLYERSLLPVCSPEEFLKDKVLQQRLFPEPENQEIPLPPPNGTVPDYRTVLQMNQVSVRYGESVILQNVDWTVAAGEKWALSGPNGSGKSTLLSLVCGDNPQAYANDITLFDRPRGTGESIWDIKRRIGTLNPDMHTFYMKDIDALAVVASGFFDSVGLYNNPTEEQYAAARAWLAALGGAHLTGRSFVRLSFGEQRLALLARAMVKDPEVLILDEPLHGLDAGRRRRALALVDAFCRRPGKTLVYVTHYREEIPPCVDRVKELPARG